MTAVRFQPRRIGIGLSAAWAVLDTVKGGYLHDAGHGTLAAIRTECDMLNRALDAPQQRPAEPCCDHAAKVERYRHALAQIARGTDREYARRIADEALAEAPDA